MAALKDHTGKEFGRLTVVQRAPRPASKGRIRTEAYWECLCSCGQSKVVSGTNLVSGNTTSCGCLHKEQLAARNQERLRQDPWEVDLKLYLRKLGYRRLRLKLGSNQFQTLTKGLEEGHPATESSWGLTLDVYKRLTSGVCYYCGAPPAQRVHGAGGSKLKKNGIDRVDNRKGYEESNCVSCCLSCNREKRAQTLEVFVGNTRRRYEWLKAKGLITS